MSSQQSYYRQINYIRLFLIICLFSVVLIVCFFIVFALEEGGEANNAYYTALWIFNLIAFQVTFFQK